jgi:hypothetical protein
MSQSGSPAPEPERPSTTPDEGVPFSIVLPPEERLTPEQRKAAQAQGWPVTVKFRGDEDFGEFIRRRDGGKDDARGGLSSITDLVVTELVRGLVRIGERDPKLAAQVLALVKDAGPSSGSGPFLMTIDEYAEHTSYSPRKIATFISEGMPSMMKGRLRRIPVADADKWLRQRGAEPEDGIEQEARRNARRAHRRSAAP